MLELILMRHAKAELGGPGVADRKRALTDRGRADARLIGSAIKRENWLPDRVLCSPATRTRQTLDALVDVFGVPASVEFVEGLYGAPASDYFDVIADEAGDARRVLVVGHNPTLHMTARIAAATGDKSLRRKIADKFPTAAFALVSFSIDGWKEIERAEGHLLAFVAPRDLGGG